MRRLLFVQLAVAAAAATAAATSAGPDADEHGGFRADDADAQLLSAAPRRPLDFLDLAGVAAGDGGPECERALARLRADPASVFCAGPALAACADPGCAWYLRNVVVEVHDACAAPPAGAEQGGEAARLLRASARSRAVGLAAAACSTTASGAELCVATDLAGFFRRPAARAVPDEDVRRFLDAACGAESCRDLLVNEARFVLRNKAIAAPGARAAFNAVDPCSPPEPGPPDNSETDFVDEAFSDDDDDDDDDDDETDTSSPFLAPPEPPRAGWFPRLPWSRYITGPPFGSAGDGPAVPGDHLGPHGPPAVRGHSLFRPRSRRYPGTLRSRGDSTLFRPHPHCRAPSSRSRGELFADFPRRGSARDAERVRGPVPHAHAADDGAHQLALRALEDEFRVDFLRRTEGLRRRFPFMFEM